MTEQQLKSQIGQLDARIRGLTYMKNQLEKQLACLICPFEVGDRIKTDKFGKGAMAEIIDIQAHSVWKWTFIVRRIKKDGSHGAEVVIRPYDNPIKVTA
jgi:hypothetical protein